MTPKETLKLWIDTFNKADAKGLAALYHEDAINHQVVTDPVVGKQAIYELFVDEQLTN